MQISESTTASADAPALTAWLIEQPFVAEVLGHGTTKASVLTPNGPHLLANFLRLAGEGDASVLDAMTGSFATRGMGEETTTRGTIR